MKPDAHSLRTQPDLYRLITYDSTPAPEVYERLADGERFGIDVGGNVYDGYLRLILPKAPAPIEFRGLEPKLGDRLAAGWRSGARLLMEFGTSPWLYPLVRAVFGAERADVVRRAQETARRLKEDPEATALELARRYGSDRLEKVGALVLAAAQRGELDPAAVVAIEEALGR